MNEEEQSIPVLLVEWQNIKEELDILFAKRENALVKPLMDKGISLFLQFIQLANGVPVDLLNGIETNQIAIKPVNLSDRLEFIIKKPTLYHSYIQLSELIVEMTKHYEKAIALKKASKH